MKRMITIVCTMCLVLGLFMSSPAGSIALAAGQTAESGGVTESPDAQQSRDGLWLSPESGDMTESPDAQQSGENLQVSPESGEEWQNARQELEEALKDKVVMALVYLCPEYSVRAEAGEDSGEIAVLKSGQQVQIHSVEKAEDGTCWVEVSFFVGERLAQGYVEREYLATADETFLNWEEKYGTLLGRSGKLAKASATYRDVEQFPASYQSALKALKQKHPNWTFVAMNTGLSWDEVVKNEMVRGRNLIPSSFPACWRDGEFGSGWSYVSSAALKYYLDPRNGLSEELIFQFEQLTYNASYHTTAAVQKFLNGTFMAGQIPGSSQTYADAFFKIGQELGVSPFHLACRVYQEQGRGTSPLISGNYPGFEGYYNYFNVGATGNTDREVIVNGLTRAKKEGWNTRYKSLYGGSKVISANYILCGQDTLYLQKFDVDAGPNGLYWHQYMQNICAPSSEGRNIRKSYESTGAINNTFVFKIPVYNNMPQAASPEPTAFERPAAPVLVKAVSADYNKIKVTWKKVANATGYHIYRKEGKGSYQKVGSVENPSATSYTDSTALTGINYTYTVKAYRTENDTTLESECNEKGVTAKAQLKIPAMKTASAVNGKDLKITWGKVNGAEGYAVFRKTANSTWKRIKTIKSAATRTYTDTKVDPGISYTYMVKAYRVVNGKTMFSPENPGGVTANTIPQAPQLKKIYQLSNGSVKLTWADTQTVSGYYIYRRCDGGKWEKIKEVKASKRAFADADVSAGHTYAYRVRPFVKNGKKIVLGGYDKNGLKITIP